jgi:hypothetical protein
MSFYFLTEFFRYFFRVLHEASSSWLKFVHLFQKHPVSLRVEVSLFVLSADTEDRGEVEF